MRIRIFFFILSFLFARLSFSAEATQQKNDKDKGTSSAGTSPTYALSGHARLSTNNIDRGLTLTDNNVGFDASFLVNLGSQFRFGFWGANVSQLDSTQDNLWLKYMAEVLVEFQQGSEFHFYVHDEHYYKDQKRNGQRFGFLYDYARLQFLYENQNNYEGTYTNADYIQFKYTYRYSAQYGTSGSVGYTFQHSSLYNDYFDFTGTVYYKPFEKGQFELGLTMPSNTSQFGSRSRFNYFLAFRLDY